MKAIHSIDCKVSGTIVTLTDTKTYKKGKPEEYQSREMLLDITQTLSNGRIYPVLAKFTFIGEKLCGALNRYNDGDNVEVLFTPKTTRRVNRRGEVFYACMNQGYSVKYAHQNTQTETYQ